MCAIRSRVKRNMYSVLFSIPPPNESVPAQSWIIQTRKERDLAAASGHTELQTSELYRRNKSF